MAMGRRRQERQDELFVVTSQIARSPGHPFYQRLNGVLSQRGFDRFVEGICSKFYAEIMGRPSVSPGVYFRCLMVGYFEGIDSERGIAWRFADSLALRDFLGYRVDESTPDHSTISRTRRLIDLETHQVVFQWVLKVLGEEDLIDGKTLGIDGTTLEANAALRSIVRRDTKESYQDFLKRLALASGIETPTQQDLAKLDRERERKGSNNEWEHPHDPDARIARMKDGRTHLAHKVEHAVDLGRGASGAVLAVTIQPADVGDTATASRTIVEATKNVRALANDSQTEKKIATKWLSQAVMDKGYHSNDVLLQLEEMEIRSYVSEPNRGRRSWVGKDAERHAVYGNRRRIRGERGRWLLRRRGEYLERSFAHAYETGRMRRVHLRGRENVLKRLLVHVSGLNLGFVMRKLMGRGTPRGLSHLFGDLMRWVMEAWSLAMATCAQIYRFGVEPRPLRQHAADADRGRLRTTFTTGC